VPTSKGKGRGIGREGKGRGCGEGDGRRVEGSGGEGRRGKDRGVQPLLSLHFKHWYNIAISRYEMPRYRISISSLG